MVRNRNRAERETPQIDGRWHGAASLEIVEMLRDQWYSMEQIATAFGVTRKTLYNRINKAKAADSRTSNGPISPLPDTDKHAPSDEGTSIPRRSA